MKRNRQGEETITEEYITSCQYYYERWIEHLDTPTYRISAEDETSETVFQKVVENILG